MAVAYLEKLNPEQRRAVEHGVRENSAPPAPPLLIIAGAGSGKTNTLAHRVAHLIVNGADPRRVLLMTFSRRAAAEMTRRVGRIARQVIGDKANIATEALTWSGTFHGIGARLLREYADRIGIDPSFTIHDRGDSADLMNVVRHERGFSKTERRFPTKDTCLKIYSRCVNAEMSVEDVLRIAFPWCFTWADQLRELFAAFRSSTWPLCRLRTRVYLTNPATCHICHFTGAKVGSASLCHDSLGSLTRLASSWEIWTSRLLSSPALAVGA